MSFEMIVGLQIKNDEKYSLYREAMTPILEEYEGGFRYDFKIAETLKNEEGRDINRVFAIFFKDSSSMDAFFKDSDYLEAKAKFFDASVSETTIISQYDRN